jgi:hypothetical protein
MQTKQDAKDIFLKAQQEKKKILLTYFSGQNSLFLTKLCIPIKYFGPISKDVPGFYYFWDDESDVGDRLFGMPPSDIKYMEITDEPFEPKEYIFPYINDM